MMDKVERQKLVDFSVMSMVTQGGPGFDYKIGTCKYNSKDGNRCGVGLLLTEEECNKYDALGVSASVIATDGVNGWSEDDGDFLNSWQECHDHAAKDAYKDEEDFIEGFRWRVQDFCDAYDLRFPEEYI